MATKFFTIGAIVGLLLLNCARSNADVDSWTNGLGGNYSSDDDWSDTVPPTTNDLAAFSIPGTYGVNFTASATAGQLLVDNGQVAFNLGAKTLHLSPLANINATQNEDLAIAQTVGNRAELTISGGTLSGSSAGIGTVSQDSPNVGGTGTLDVVNGGKISFQDGFSGKFVVGNNSTGTLNVASGGQAVLDNLSIASGSSSGTVSSGLVTVTGSTSAITVNSDLTMGDHPGATAVMQIEDGGTVTTNICNVGSDGGTSALTVDAATFNVHSLNVGVSGSLTLQHDAMLAGVTNFLGKSLFSIGFYNGDDGTLSVQGAGNTLTSTGDLTIGVTSPLNPGHQSTAQLRVVGGGSVLQIGGDLVMGVGQTSLSAIIDATGLSSLQIAGSASLSGGLDVELDDFVPTVGERFTVLTADKGISGSLGLAGPDAPDFQLSQFGDSLDLVYTGVPEPTALSLVTLLGVGHVNRRMRRTITAERLQSA